MRRLLCAVLLWIGCASLATAGTVRTFEHEFEAKDLRSLALDVPVGEIDVRGVDEPRVSVEVRVQCDRGDDDCRDAAEDVELVSRERGAELRLDFDGVDGLGDHEMSLDVELRVPLTMALDVDLAVGDLHVDGLNRDVRVEVGVGQVKVRMKEELVGSVDLEVGVGEATMGPDPRRRSRSRSRRFDLGEDVRWDEGTGEARIRIDVGVGGIDVRLR